MSSQPLPAVRVANASKAFSLPRERVHTLKERALHPLRRQRFDRLRALEDISFSVPQGEFFGIVGRNGSGKSTLLKCMAGIYAADAGDIYVNGRMSTFIELGVGFNPDLAARDNVMINAAMLGLSRREAARRFDQVIEFAELEDFVDLKLKNYSSGMLVRLAFSVMIQVDADVLLIDEVLAVGDASFQQKCFDEFERIRRSGTTVLLVTHDMSSVRRFCDRAMLLENGRMVEIGDPEHVGERYLELNFSQDARKEAQVEVETQRAAEGDAEERAEPERTVGGPDRTEGEEPTRYGDRRAEIVDAWFEREDGSRTTVLPTGRPFRFAARARFNEDVDDPLFGVIFHDPRGIYVMSASSIWKHPQLGVRRAGDEVTYRISYENVLAPGRFLVSPAVACHGHWLDRRDRMLSVMVTGTRETEGVVDPPYEIDIQTDPVARDAVEA